MLFLTDDSPRTRNVIKVTVFLLVLRVLLFVCIYPNASDSINFPSCIHVLSSATLDEETARLDHVRTAGNN